MRVSLGGFVLLRLWALVSVVLGLLRSSGWWNGERIRDVCVSLSSEGSSSAATTAHSMIGSSSVH